MSIHIDFYFGEKKAHRIMPVIMATFVKKKWHKLDRISFYPSFAVLFGSENVIDRPSIK